MKIGDYVEFLGDPWKVDDDRRGIIVSFDPLSPERIWIHWLDSAEEQWATEEELELLSEA